MIKYTICQKNSIRCGQMDWISLSRVLTFHKSYEINIDLMMKMTFLQNKLVPM